MAPTTRCKFRVNSIETFGPGAPVKVKLGAIYPDPERDGYAHDENHAFFNATPFGQIELSIQNPYGAELFQAGDDFYVDFEKAPKPEPPPAS
jgi:hypothetical protein